MISYGKQSIFDEDIEEVVKVLKSDFLTQGSTITLFENDLKNKFGSNYCSVVSNGTAALHLSGLVLGWRPEDIILTSPISFIATANCIIYSGATPDFVDIDPISYTIDPNHLEDKIKTYRSGGKSVKAVIGVDYAGHPCDWKSLREIANKYDLQLVNDNCHALGAAYYGDKKYATKYADIVTQSFHPVKHFTTGEGGSIMTNNEELDDKIKILRTHGITKPKDNKKENIQPWIYEMHNLGFNYRITDFQCALGISQLKKLDKFIAKRREISAIYDSSLKDIENFIIPKVDVNSSHAFHLYPLQILFNEISISKTDLFKNFKDYGIALQVHYIPIHLQPFYVKNYGFSVGDFPIAENFYNNAISLPIFYDLSREELRYVIDKLKTINK
tara:strand:- start:2752 stop:3912 length:1161 start_codon:yes stop_codon:yes gene_type:complete